MTPLSQQTILITGATDGLGRHLAEHLARSGARLLLHGRDAARGVDSQGLIGEQRPGGGMAG